MKSPDNILVIRNDKLGDFILALPSFMLLKKQYPHARITALVPDYTAPIARYCQWIDNIIIDDKKGNSFSGIMSLARRLRKEKFDLSITLFLQTHISLSLMLAGIPLRVGPATKIAQFFLNRKLKQKRSLSLKPEYEYNLDLCRYAIRLNDAVKADVKPPYLLFEKHLLDKLRNSLTELGVFPEKRILVLIHPGSGGSAINLSIKQYALLAQAINNLLISSIASGEEKPFFIISAGPGEEAIAESLAKLIPDLEHNVYVSSDGILAFCRFISLCDLFIGGSTGPLHIAGALNKKTAAFYPARRSATPLRWQTLNDADKRLAFSPQQHIDENDMQHINIEEAAREIVSHFFNSTGFSD